MHSVLGYSPVTYSKLLHYLEDKLQIAEVRHHAWVANIIP